MSKVNPTVKSESKFDSERLAGGAGALAAKQSMEAQLRRLVLANLLWEDLAYVDGQTVSSQIATLITYMTDQPKVVADLAIETRLMQKLRHTPLFMISEMARHKEYNPYIRECLKKVCTRADMLTDFLAIYWSDGKRKLTAQVKKGLADAFSNFNEYQLAKYDRDAAIKLRDVIRLVHPVPKDEEQNSLFERVVSRTLATPDTWEVALSNGADKKATWERLIAEHKLGGLAMLRNLRNMKKVDVNAASIREGLANLHASMLLPLDFLKAKKVAPEFNKELEDAMIRGYANLPKLPGRTLFILDCSGSMYCQVSAKSEFNRLDCAKAMAMLAANQCEDFELVCTAGNDSSRIGAHMKIKYPAKGFELFSQVNATKGLIGGGGIFTRQCLEWCRKQYDGDFDRIIVFSDSQDCDYPEKSVPKPFGKYNYIVDVSAHSHGINYNGVWTAEISGWSEHFLTFIAASEGLENSFEEE